MVEFGGMGERIVYGLMVDGIICADWTEIRWRYTEGIVVGAGSRLRDRRTGVYLKRSWALIWVSF